MFVAVLAIDVRTRQSEIQERLSAMEGTMMGQNNRLGNIENKIDAVLKAM